MKKFGAFIILLLISSHLMAQNIPGNQYFTKEIPEKANREFQFIAYYINQGVTSNMYPENDFLKGQIVGRLFGGNTSKTSNTKTSAYVEQRLIPFFIYQPSLFNGKAILRASFELDWTWGDAAYGVGGNFGGGFSADQVNLQTQNLELELIPAKTWAINLGLQRIFDTPYNPYRTVFDKMSNTGYRLAYFGTDGTGISVRKDNDFSRIKAGFYKLYENYVHLNDDVSLMELTGEKDITKNWKLGASLYYVRDRASGAGGVSILGQGLNSLMASHNGVYQFAYGDVPNRADVGWAGMFFSRNADHWVDPWQLSGFFNMNFGKADTLSNQKVSKTDFTRATNIFGYAGNLRASYRYGQTLNDNLTLDVTYTSGDANGLSDKKYSGVITGNQWGAPGAIFISSGSYLLMPHGNVVNRFTPTIPDISNMGYGLTAAVLTASKGFIPNKVIGKMGIANAFGNVAPKGGGHYMGTELNSSLSYNFGPFMSLEVHGAYLKLGDFYDSKQASYGSAVNGGIDGRPVSPWTAFAVFKWLMF
ncbi:MAG: hypothetical protein U0V04_01085 [Spirosomataceae bacterium]